MSLRLILSVAAIAVLGAVGGASARTAAPEAANTNWASWGNTLDQTRYSPLTQVDASNVGQLGRVTTVDLNKLVPGIKKGQQTYPIVDNGTMYITSGDDQVFAVDATSGNLIWKYAPDNIATFKNYGIVANRGVAVCDGHVYLLTLDMTIVSLDAQTGKQVARVPIARAVPGAQANYGYSETSAPICDAKNHELIFGAAGSEYGVRGFVMAYKTPNLAPAWANPFWTVPPDNTQWRKAARIVGGGAVWTPVTIDPTTNTLYFGTGAGMPPYFPSLRPGPDPRTDSIVALDEKSGKLKWWQQQLSSNQWSYDTSQPPMVYDAKVGGKTQRIVSVATMEGVWFAYNAATGQPLWQRVKVIDNVEHPNLKPGKPVVVYPSSLGGLNFSPAAFDPKTGYVYNAASETASVLVQQTSAEREKQALLTGDVFLGLANGDYGQYLQNGWKDYGSVSAIDVATGKRVWKFDTPQPERGGPTMTASGIGFVGGGDGNLRAFDAKNGKVLWTFQTGYQISAGPSVYSVNGTEYVAIGVGGTPTSSSGGTVASQVQIFALGGSHSESTAPQIAGVNMRVSDASATQTAAPRQTQGRTIPGRSTKGSKVSVAGPSNVYIKAWDPDTSNTQDVEGHVTLAGKPVKGLTLSFNGWIDPSKTDDDGAFTYPADITAPTRHVAKIVSVSGATIDGKPLTPAQKDDLLGRQGGINVGYQVTDVSTKRNSDGTITLSGKLVTQGTKEPPPSVVLYSYMLRGKITDASGKPVQGAVVTTRTNDRQYWTQSRPTGANGSYASFLVAADQEGDDPVPMQIGIAVGQSAYAEPAADQIMFSKLRSASLDVQLPSSASTPLPKTSLQPQAVPGAIYQGLLVGVVGGKGGVIRPVRATWPSKADGTFTLVLPKAAAGQTVHFWESQRQFFSTQNTQAGGSVDLSIYPKRLPSDAPQNLSSAKLPG